MIYTKIYVFRDDIEAYNERVDTLEFIDAQDKLDYVISLYRVISVSALSLERKKEYLAKFVTFGLSYDFNNFIEYEAGYNERAEGLGIAADLDYYRDMVLLDVPYRLLSKYIDEFLSMILGYKELVTKYNDTIYALIAIKEAHK